MRPRFHFTAEAGWINDPHGITYREGRYHVFFQHAPGRITWNIGCHWGHGAGEDLLSLAELPNALRPGDDDDGVWTGTLVDGGDRARIFYTSVQNGDPDIGRIRVADPVAADWIEWKKGDVVATAPVESNSPRSGTRSFVEKGESGGCSWVRAFVAKQPPH